MPQTFKSHKKKASDSLVDDKTIKIRLIPIPSISGTAAASAEVLFGKMKMCLQLFLYTTQLAWFLFVYIFQTWELTR